MGYNKKDFTQKNTFNPSKRYTGSVSLNNRSYLQGIIVLVIGTAFLHSTFAQESVYVMPLKANFIGPSTVEQVNKLITIAEENRASAAVISKSSS